MEKLTQAARYERDEQRQGYRSGHYNRNLTTTSGDVTLKVTKLKGISSPRSFSWSSLQPVDFLWVHAIGMCEYGDLIKIVGTAPLQRDHFFYGCEVNVQDIPVQGHLPYI